MGEGIGERFLISSVVIIVESPIERITPPRIIVIVGIVVGTWIVIIFSPEIDLVA
jgi:hypothetical protein